MIQAHATQQTSKALGISGDGFLSAWKTVVKTTSENRTAATFTDDDSLKFTMIENTTYRFRMHVSYLGDDTDEFKCKLLGPGTPTRLTIERGLGPASSLNDSVVIRIGADFSTYAGTESLMSGTTGPGSVHFSGVVENGTTAGDLVFQWGTLNGGGNNATVLKGSYLEYSEL